MSKVTCVKCGWVHVTFSKATAIAEGWYVPRRENCFNCGARDFRSYQDGDVPRSATLQRVLIDTGASTDQKFASAKVRAKVTAGFANRQRSKAV